MNIIDKNTISLTLLNGFHFDIGKYISKGFELFKKDMGMFVLSFLVLLLTCWIPVLNIVVQTNYFTICHKIDNGEKAQISDLFNFDKVIPLIIFYLLAIGVVILFILPIVIPLILNGAFNNFDGQESLKFFIFIIFAFLLSNILIILFAVLSFFVVPLIQFGKYHAIEAIRISLGLVKKNFL